MVGAVGTLDVIYMLLARLSGHTRDKCVWYVLSIWRIESWEPNFGDFIKFGEDKTLIKNNPLFSKSEELISIMRDHQKVR